MSRLFNAFLLVSVISVSSCEEVIQIDLNSADKALVIEAVIFRDSVAKVQVSLTADYFSDETPGYVEDASIVISDGITSEELAYVGNGAYTGNTLTGIEGRTYSIDVLYNGTNYKGVSFMPSKAEIIAVDYVKFDEQSIFNPNGDVGYTIDCEFTDDPDTNNYYMIRFVSDGKMLEDSYYLMSEDKTNDGILEHRADNTLRFSESVFYTGGEVDIQLFSIDRTTYDFFIQLNDVLFWKRRIMPPTPYNPLSNISNGALGYFAAWSFDYRSVILQ